MDEKRDDLKKEGFKDSLEGKADQLKGKIKDAAGDVKGIRSPATLLKYPSKSRCSTSMI